LAQAHRLEGSLGTGVQEPRDGATSPAAARVEYWCA